MKKILAWLIILVTLLSPMSFANEKPTPKQEVVYTKLALNGSVDLLSVVNVFRLDNGGTVTDFGDYEEVINLTNLEPIDVSGETITTRADKGVFYYQGNDPNQELPWLIGLSYYLDGKRIKGEDLAGASGELKVDLNIKQNLNANPVFFEHYLLQVSFQFPQEKFSLISAKDATEAINGEDKMLTFTVLPNKDAQISFTAQVENFSMKPVMLNGLPFQMALELPNLDDSLSDLTLLQDAIRQLNDGAQALAGGLSLAKDGGGQLFDGAGTLAGAGVQMSDGMDEFTDGLVQYHDGLKQYRDGVVSFDKGLGQLVSGVEQLSSGLNDYAAGSDTATDGLNQYVDGVDAYVGGINQALTMIQPIVGEIAKAKDIILAIDFSQAIELSKASSNQIEQSLNQIAAMLEEMDTSELDAMKTNSANFLAMLEEIDANSGTIPGLSDTISSLQSATQNLEASLVSLQTISTNLRSPDLTAIGADPADPNTTLMLSYMAGQADQLDAAISQIQTGTVDPLNSAIVGLQALDATLQQSFTALGSLADSYRPIDTLIQNYDLSQLSAMKDQAIAAAASYSELNRQIQAYLNDMDESLPEILKQVVEGIGQAETGLDQLKSGGDQLTSAGSQVKSGFAQLNDGAHGLAGGGVELADGARQLRTGSNGLAGGITTLTDNFTQMVGGSSQISYGLRQLADGMGAYQNGVNAYVDGVAQAGDGSSLLANGTDQLYRETSGMDEKFKEKMEEMTEEFLPKDFDPVSFVSDKNENIEVVQFVMMSPGIELPEDNTDQVVEESKQTIWDRIVALFAGISQ